MSLEFCVDVVTTGLSISMKISDSKHSSKWSRRAKNIILLFRQQQKLLKALEKLEAGPASSIPQSVSADYSKQPVRDLIPDRNERSRYCWVAYL